MSTHTTDHTNPICLANLRINYCVGKHGEAVTTEEKPEKNQTPDISVVRDERKGCTAVITFGVDEGKTARGCLGYLIMCALMRLRMRACALYIRAYACPTNPLARTCISPSNH